MEEEVVVEISASSGAAAQYANRLGSIKRAIWPILIILGVFVAYSIILALAYIFLGKSTLIVVIGTVVIPPLAGTTYIFWGPYKKAIRNRRRVFNLSSADVLAVLVTGCAVYFETADQLRQEASPGRIIALFLMLAFLAAGFVIIANFEPIYFEAEATKPPRYLSGLHSLLRWLLQPLFSSLAHVVSFYVAGAALFFLTLSYAPWVLWICMVAALVIMALWDSGCRRFAAPTETSDEDG